MNAYKTKEDLLAAYAEENKSLHWQFHHDAPKYVPHLYRGGFVIRGFGYSVERIGRFVTADNAGNAYLV
jgi:hypothetical protein